jgi:hypothetical protein
MQQWHEEPRPETATTWQQEDRRPLPQTVTTFWKQEGKQWDLLEDHWAGDIEARCRDFHRVAKNHKLDLVERSVTPEKKEEPIRSFGIRGARNVGAPATRDSLTLPIENKNFALW